MSHDCSLCCDPVTLKSGRVILPCGHQNHVSCITKRFVNQGEDAECPLCKEGMKGLALPYRDKALAHTAQDCSICFETVKLKTGQVTLPCGHQNHLSCITRWFAQQDGKHTCPLCRDPMEGLARPYEPEPEPESDTETVTFGEVNPIRVYNWNPAESGRNTANLAEFFETNEANDFEPQEPEIPMIDRRISLNKTEFLWVYHHAFYVEKLSLSTVRLWDYIVDRGVYETAPPTFPGEKRYYFSFKELRSLILGDCWFDLTSEKWETLNLFMAFTDTEAYLSMSGELPIQLPVR